MKIMDYVYKGMNFMRNIHNKKENKEKKQRSNFSLGKIAKFSLLTLSIYGILAWIGGIFPFTRVKEKEFIPTQYFFGREGPVLEGPGTPWYLTPIYNKIIVNNQEVKIDGNDKEAEIPQMDFSTSNNFEGKIRNIQYTYRIENGEDASKYYWIAEQNKGLIDGLIGGAIREKISQTSARELVKEIGGLTDQAKEELNTQEDSLYDLYGVKIVTLRAPNAPDFDPTAQKSLELITKATLEKEATLEIIKATESRAISYLSSAKLLYPDGNQQQHADIALKLMDFDNNALIADKGATIFKNSGGYSPYQMIPYNQTRTPETKDKTGLEEKLVPA